MKRRFIAILAIVMVAVMFPVSAEPLVNPEDVLTYQIVDENVTITDCLTSAAGTLEIPAEIEGYPVTAIGNEAFCHCTKLTSIKIPDGVKTIGDNAFNACYSLQSIEIPNGVETIGEQSFASCDSLEAIEIPDSVKTIGDQAFWACGLHSIVMGSGIESVGFKAFLACYIENVYIKDLSAWCNIDYEFYGPDYWGGERYDGRTSPLFHDPLSEPAKNLYLNGELICDLVLPDGVTSIPDFAFSCQSLQSVTFPNTITTIGNYSFSGCKALDSLTLPDSLKTIKAGAFWNCVKLSAVSLGDGLQTIETLAFRGCNSLKKVYISDLAALCSIDIDEDVNLLNGRHLYLNNKLLKNLMIPEGISVIKPNAFYGCTSITAVSFSDGVNSIGDYAFSNCSNLQDVSFPDGVNSIGDYAFSNCSNLQDATFSNTVKTIGSGAFSNSGLITVAMPDSIETVGSTAFAHCKYLEKVNLSNNLKEIAVATFLGCEKLTQITIPDDVESIEEQAFQYCNTLRSITIGSGLTHIDLGAFFGCYDLSDVHIKSLEQWLKMEGTQHDEYGYNKPLMYYADHIFLNGKLLEEVVVPAGVKVINPYALNTADIHSVTLHSDVQEVQAYAFGAGLRRIYLPKTTDVIGESAFADSSFLKRVFYGGTAQDVEDQMIIEPCNNSFEKARWSYNENGLPNHSYSNFCDEECNECGLIRAVQGHSYSSVCDTTCNVCGATRSGSGHWYIDCNPSCDRCGAPRNVKHNYTDACDTSCNRCGTKRSITHSFGAYVFNEDATSKADGTQTRTCTVCKHKETVTAPGTKIANPFVDLVKDQYYVEPVLWAVGKKITTGTAADTFSPEEACTRGQIVTFLWRAAGKPEPKSSSNPFWDVPSDQYYYKAVLWAVENGITTGTSAGTFEPESACTRGQIVTFLHRAKGKPAAGSSNPFYDVSGSAYYYSPVLWAVQNGITTGTSATTFEPEASCTRAQIVTFLYRAYK